MYSELIHKQLFNHSIYIAKEIELPSTITAISEAVKKITTEFAKKYSNSNRAIGPYTGFGLIKILKKDTSRWKFLFIINDNFHWTENSVACYVDVLLESSIYRAFVKWDEDIHSKSFNEMTIEELLNTEDEKRIEAIKYFTNDTESYEDRCRLFGGTEEGFYNDDDYERFEEKLINCGYIITSSNRIPLTEKDREEDVAFITDVQNQFQIKENIVLRVLTLKDGITKAFWMKKVEVFDSKTVFFSEKRLTFKREGNLLSQHENAVEAAVKTIGEKFIEL